MAVTNHGERSLAREYDVAVPVVKNSIDLTGTCVQNFWRQSVDRSKTAHENNIAKSSGSVENRGSIKEISVSELKNSIDLTGTVLQGYWNREDLEQEKEFARKEALYKCLWQEAKEKLSLPLEDRIGVMPPCLCNDHPENTGLNLSESIKLAKSIAELCPIVRHASVQLSLMGKLEISVKNYDGVADIDALAKRVMEIINENLDFDQNERSHGKTIAPLITALYQEGDILINESCLITRICVFVRNFPIWCWSFLSSRTCSVTRWDWFTCEEDDFRFEGLDGYHQAFTWYTKNQHENVFFEPFNSLEHRVNNRYFNEEITPLENGLTMTKFVRYSKSEFEPKFMDRGEILSALVGTFTAQDFEDRKFDAITSAAAHGFEDTLEKLLNTESWGQGDNRAQALVLSAMHQHWGCVDLLLKHKRLLPYALVSAISHAEYYNEQTQVEKLTDYLFNEANFTFLGKRPKSEVSPWCKIICRS